jgi:hypothetical protein
MSLRRPSTLARVRRVQALELLALALLANPPPLAATLQSR